MQLKTVGGHLTLGSAYKLFVVGWIISWGITCGLIVACLIGGALITGEMYVNGALVQGRAEVFAAMWPIILFVPLIPVMHAFMFGALWLLGVWLYTKRRPIQVVAE